MDDSNDNVYEWVDGGLVLGPQGELPLPTFADPVAGYCPLHGETKQSEATTLWVQGEADTLLCGLCYVDWVRSHVTILRPEPDEPEEAESDA